jgi:hypothetical protein
MVALGFATGWRPSMMRPLRREGPSADVLWDKNVVLARRSQTRGDEVRQGGKSGGKKIGGRIGKHANRIEFAAPETNFGVISADG